MASCKTILLICQSYPPDPMAVGQHLHDAAVELVSRGYRVVCLTANSGYDDPSVRYPSMEMLDGVEVHRLRFGNLGKGSLGRRALGGVLFTLQAAIRGLFVPRLSRVVVSTVPPMGPVAALALSALRRVPFTFWVMDLNPDQAIAVGRVAPGSISANLMEYLARTALAHASHVVTLDSQMAQRLRDKAPDQSKLSVIPPWSPRDDLAPMEHHVNPFRRAHRLEGKLVVMYSGNLSLVHPLDTVLDAAKELRNDEQIAFVFVGGGAARIHIERSVARSGLDNVTTLPYQPAGALRYSLAAADIHLVSMGDAMRGIVHPCKIYGAMAVGRPILALGPRDSHVANLVITENMGWAFEHGDVEGVVSLLTRVARSDRGELQHAGARARQVFLNRFSRQNLVSRFCDCVTEPGLPDGH